MGGSTLEAARAHQIVGAQASWRRGEISSGSLSMSSIRLGVCLKKTAKRRLPGVLVLPLTSNKVCGNFGPSIWIEQGGPSILKMAVTSS